MNDFDFKIPKYGDFDFKIPKYGDFDFKITIKFGNFAHLC